MITATVLASNEDSLPDLDPSNPKASVLRVLTDCPNTSKAEFWMDVVDPKPKLGDAIHYDIWRGFSRFAEWNGVRVKQRGYSHPM